MKKLVEVSGEGLESLMGETVVLFCMNYFYTGKLIGVNTDDIILQKPKIIYETGSFEDKGWKDAQELKFCDELYVRTSSIESYGQVK